MGAENRTVTAVAYGGVQDTTATPPELCHERFTDWNAWQDSTCRAMSLDGAMTPAAQGFEDIEGCLKFFCQTPVHAAGTYQDLPLIGNPHGPAFELFYPFDRIIEITIWGDSDPANLFKGATYDPDNVEPLTRRTHLWFTGGGATNTNPPIGDFWKPWFGIDIYLYANTAGAVADQALRMANLTLVDYYFVMMGTITQRIT